jgi:hypothetical protein
MLEIDVSGQTYQIGKLNAFQQLHVTRRIAPVIPKLVPGMVALSTQASEQATQQVTEGTDAAPAAENAAPSSSLTISEVVAAFGPALEAFSAMTDEDTEYVFGTCLAVVKRKQGNSWAPIWNPSVKLLMFSDIDDLSLMSQIVVKVLEENVAPFFRAALGSASSPTPTKQ